MGRPPLFFTPTTVRLPQEIIDEIDALVGSRHRAKFIRLAIENELRESREYLLIELKSAKSAAPSPKK